MALTGDKPSKEATALAEYPAYEILRRLEQRNHVLRDERGNAAPVMTPQELVEIIAPVLDSEREKARLTAQDIFLALIAELDHPSGYITKDPMSLDSVTVDGVISCEGIAEFLNAREQAADRK